MKKIIIPLLALTIALSFSACGSSSSSESNSHANSTVSETPSSSETTVIEINGSELGEYGTTYTFNSDAAPEDQETIIEYHIPAGTYTVTNVGSTIAQLNVYSDETHITDEGWEEPAECYYVKLLKTEESDTVTIADGQYIEIASDVILKFELQ